MKLIQSNKITSEKSNLHHSMIEWNETTDVVIIGSGFAGLTAAIEAKNSGASVLVLEKMSAPGGNSIISDGGIAAAWTDIQKREGIEDSPELMYQDMMKAGLGLNYPELLRVVVDHSKEAFEWSKDYLQVEYLDRIDIFGGHSVPRCYTPIGVTGATIIKKQMEKIKRLNIEVRFKVCFQHFILDDKGSVCGIVVLENYNYKDNTQGVIKYIKAEKGVVLATGGYGADVVFRQLQDPRLKKDIDTTNKPFATAEALKEALRIGAAPIQLSQIQLGAWASPDEKGFGDGPLFADYILFQYGIIVDPSTGTRFVNELGDRKLVADALLNRQHPCVGISDDSAVKEAGWNIEKALRKNVVRTFNNIDDLAEFYNFNKKELTRTIERYNGFVENNKDLDFGKQIVQNAKPIKEAPYYAMRLWPKVHFTMGGIRINSLGQVQDYEGNTIKGLFAAGEVTGGVHGASRLGSCAVTECLVFGRIVGRNVVEL